IMKRLVNPKSPVTNTFAQQNSKLTGAVSTFQGYPERRHCPGGCARNDKLPYRATSIEPVLGPTPGTHALTLHMDEEIINQSRSDCGHEPKDTILALVTKDGDFSSLFENLKSEGVGVYLISPASGFDQRLVDAVGKKHWLRF
ncbi:MAG: hypothetical protein HY670_05160, partial [Chloroflexi bacterium]|nr:hypothetical protein [Chloroflexota bacterium]